MSEENTEINNTKLIALVGLDDTATAIFNTLNFGECELVHYKTGMEMAAAWQNGQLPIAAVVCNSEIMAPSGLALVEALKNKGLPSVPFFLIVNHLNKNLVKLALSTGIADVFKLPLKPENIQEKIIFLINNWATLKTNLQNTTPKVKKIELSKRIFDLVFAGGALLFLSPLFLIIYILVKLESKGPAFYYSLRVGTGYKVFKFYKFRSMYVNADQRIKDLKHLNQYNIDAGNEPKQTETASHQFLCDTCQSYGKCQYPLYSDNVNWCEKDFRFNKQTNAGSAFFKIKNDPRITKVGNFIRNTSIDELPQLWNVIIGNMSIVGNRPLPLYEAEKLTTDKYVLRFSAPAGITGLWQVEKRGKGEMSEDERLMLDNTYAQNHSFKNDIKLILKTIPALFQKENV
ncbi:sugar transferase [Mucilaginibacter calamicampi]|uniref:Sugar transferase n=1 Tax=Mucilaginibacter calamicampi TaxID=1302352 RepID=A0ABW2YVB2_9SPHI